MIVIAIIAIIAAIAIPNLLESRITANEANAATSLKSGLFPGQVQYQAGGYVDINTNGRGIFAGHPSYMAGTTGAADTITAAPKRVLQLLDPKFNNSSGATGNCVVATSNGTRSGAYDYACFIDVANETNAESYWGAAAAPITTDGNNGRRSFGVNAAGTIYQTKGTVALASLTLTSAQGQLFASSTAAISSVAGVGGSAVPYQK
jgi:type II secretory pathway pseudopilin PulG